MTDRKPQKTNLRAIVVGGGMGGLAAANALIQKGLDVTVYEQAPELGEVGAGIFIYPNSLRQMHRMGFEDALAKVGARVGAGSMYRRMDGSEVGPIVMADSSGWNGFYGMHRADILEAFAAALPPGTVKCGHRAIGFSQDANSATVTFENGHSDTADLIVAADGLRSVLQPFATEPSEPEYSGFRAYRGLVERSKLDSWYDETHQVWMGDGKHFMVFPVRRGELLNYVGFVPMDIATVESWSAEGDRDELAADFADWDPMIGKLLDKVDHCFWWGLNDRRPLKSWSNGRLTLLGDAAHPMLPHLGQGVNQAIEDGVALSMLLEGRSSADVPQLLQTYERLRKPRTDMVQTEARKNGMRYDSLYDSIEQRDHEIRNIAGLRLSLYDYDVEKEVKEAMAEMV